MSSKLVPPQNTVNPSDPSFRLWFFQITDFINNLFFINLNFTGSDITSIETRNHNDLQNFDGGTDGEYYHLTNTEFLDLTAGENTTLHFHDADRDLANASGILTEANGGTGTDSYVVGDILYSDATDTLSKLPIGAEDYVLTVVSGTPAWAPATGGGGGSSKIYEPVVVAGFDLNVTYIGASPTVPAFLTDTNGDIIMAWGGDYAT